MEDKHKRYGWINRFMNGFLNGSIDAKAAGEPIGKMDG